MKLLVKLALEDSVIVVLRQERLAVILLAVAAEAEARRYRLHCSKVARVVLTKTSFVEMYNPGLLRVYLDLGGEKQLFDEEKLGRH